MNRGAVRAMAWTLALAVLALPLVGLFMGWFAASHWPVRSLRVDGPFEHVPAAEVRGVVTPLLKEGFFAVDAGRIQQAVAALPWVEHAEVRKHWPDQVRITLIEQQPFARWNSQALINRRGQVFQVPDAATIQGLPELAGPADSQQEVLEFYLDARRRLATVGLPVTGTSLSRRGNWRVRLAGGAEIVIGKDTPRPRLARFVDGFARLASGRIPRFISADLRYSNGFAMRWPDPEDSNGGPPPA